jgi:hypothetical protein
MTFDSCLPRKIAFAMLVSAALLPAASKRDTVERVLLISIDGMRLISRTVRTE